MPAMRLMSRLGRLRDQFESSGLPRLLRFRTITAVYAALLAPLAFLREIRVVSAGQRQFFRGRFRLHDPLLRRNIHRLEKGLTMRPRAPVFAEEYILETVQAYAKAVASHSADPSEIAWAGDVLQTYFSSVRETPSVTTAKVAFKSVYPPDQEVPFAVPAPRGDLAPTAVGYQDFLALCQQRKSVRWYLDRRVPRALVENALSVALSAPSACNRQPFTFRFIEDPTEAAQIASVAMGTGGYAHQIPALVVVLGDFSCFPSTRDRHVPYIDGALAAMQFMLALETLGLSSCAINWPDIGSRERRMRSLLALPSHIRPIMLMSLGFADPQGGVPHSAKKPVSSVLVSKAIE